MEFRTYGMLRQVSTVLEFAQTIGRLTRDNITGIHGILVLNEAKAIHELDLSDFAGAVGLEMSLDFCLGGIAGEIP